MSLTKQEAIDISDGIRNSFKIQNAVGFGDMNIKAPDIDLYPDNEAYFDSANHTIHIGSFLPLTAFGTDTEEEYVNALNYLRGHEEQHCRSTADIPYSWGVQRGCEVVLEYIASQVEKSKRRFRTKKDYADYADIVLPKQGIYISYQMLQQIIAGLANCLEDGRIERIRANKFTGFEKQRMLFRGKVWDCNKEEMKQYDEIKDNASEKLRIITNQILSLATVQLYTKGFVAAYAGTPLMKEVQDMMPYIAKAVMAGRTRGMAEQVAALSGKLAPYLYEVCRLSEQDVKTRNELQQMLQDLIKAALDSMEHGSLSEKDEEQGEGVNSAFGHSDLVITLDDETYDRLMKNARNQSGSGGIMIRREHPLKDEDEPEDGESGNGAGSQKDGEDGEKENSGNTDNKKPSNTGKGEKENAGKDSGKDKGEDKGDAGTVADEDSEGDSEGGHEETGEKGGSTDSDTDVPRRTHGKVEPGSVKGENKESKRNASVEEKILEQMKDAASETNEKAKEEYDNINVARAHERTLRGPETADRDKPLRAEDVRDICPEFKEFKRTYKLSERLPAVINARGKALLRKNQMYFKSLSTPNVSYLDSGSIDPSRIYGLSFGDTQIFRKKGMDRKFDGCAYILMDNSGSMAGRKRTEACKAAAVIEESFRGLIPIKITAFDYNCEVIHETVKGWEENMNLNCSWNFCLHGRDGGGNADGYSIQIAARELMRRPEQKKLLIVLSDGMPTGTTEVYTKGAISAARKMGISVHGIYFEEGSLNARNTQRFAAMYEKDYICCPVSEVDQNLSALMKKFSRS